MKQPTMTRLLAIAYKRIYSPVMVIHPTNGVRFYGNFNGTYDAYMFNQLCARYGDILDLRTLAN